MTQLSLFDPSVEEFTGLTCSNGNPSPHMLGYDGPHHCPACARQVEEMCKQFASAVERGEFDSEGYELKNGKRRR